MPSLSRELHINSQSLCSSTQARRGKRSGEAGGSDRIGHGRVLQLFRRAQDDGRPNETDPEGRCRERERERSLARHAVAGLVGPSRASPARPKLESVACGGRIVPAYSTVREGGMSVGMANYVARASLRFDGGRSLSDSCLSISPSFLPPLPSLPPCRPPRLSTRSGLWAG